MNKQHRFWKNLLILLVVALLALGATAIVLHRDRQPMVQSANASDESFNNQTTGSSADQENVIYLAVYVPISATCARLLVLGHFSWYTFHRAQENK